MRLCILLCIELSLPCVFLAACGGSGGTPEVMPLEVTDADGGAVAETCPEGLVSWPQGGCAPRVDECKNPWELPLVGGGCLPIGPRACPKTWEPEADVDCEAGTLMEYDGSPCPEGFVLTEDEVACIPFFAEDGVCGDMEIPALGGGCLAVGPDGYDAGQENGGLDVPVFDACPSGRLPLDGGGCALVGPRACPKLWDPESDADCKPGDVLPCPKGWVESADALRCEPVYDECPPGERPLLGGGCERVVKEEKDCPLGPFPEVPGGASDVVYVLAASQCTGGCGSKEAPFASIQAAADSAPDGAYLLVGEGIYGEGVLIEKPLHVRGLCAARTILTGATALESQGPGKIDLAGLAVVDADGVSIAGIGVQSAAAGVVVMGSGGFALADMDLAGNIGVAIYVEGPGAGSIERSWVHDSVPGVESGMEGVGIWVESGADVTMKETLVEAARSAGLYATDNGTSLIAVDCTVRGTTLNANGFGGYGLRTKAKASVSLKSTLMDGNRSSGVIVVGASASLDGCLVRNTQVDGDGMAGFGVMIGQGADLALVGSALDGNSTGGLFVQDSGTVATLAQSVMVGTLPNKTGEFGTGISIAGAGAAHLSGCMLLGNTMFGLVAQDVGSTAEVAGSLIVGTKPTAKGEWGWGLHASAGSNAHMVDAVVEGNVFAGVAVFHPGTQVLLESSVVRATDVGSEDTDGGYGAMVAAGGTLLLTGTLIDGCTTGGVAASGEGSAVEMSRSSVRGTQPSAKGENGFGVGSGSGAKAVVTDSAIEGNRVGLVAQGQGSAVTMAGSIVEQNDDWGLMVQEAGSEATVDNCLVRGNNPALSSVGAGMRVDQGGLLAVGSSLLAGNGVAGIIVTGASSTASIGNSMLRETVGDKDLGLGYGLGVTLGAVVSVDSTAVEGNSMVGIVVQGSGSDLDVKSSACTGTVPQVQNGNPYGAGIIVTEGGRLSATASLVSGNTADGIYAHQVGSDITVRQCAVRNTLPGFSMSEESTTPSIGYGVSAAFGSRFAVHDSLVEGNAGYSAVALKPGTLMTLSRSVVRGNKAGMLPDGMSLGFALFCVDGAEMALSGVSLEKNEAAGIGCGSEGTVVDVLGSIVRDTLASSTGMSGFGMAATSKAVASMAMCLLHGNRTYGVGAFEGSTVSLSQSAIMETEAGGESLVVDGVARKQAFGDGAVAHGAELDLSSTVVAANKRCGAYYYTASGGISGSAITANGFYGLALDQCASQVEWEGNGNVIFGNATGMPLELAAQVTTSTGGMPVPPAPEMIEVPSGPVE